MELGGKRSIMCLPLCASLAVIETLPRYVLHIWTAADLGAVSSKTDCVSADCEGDC